MKLRRALAAAAATAVIAPVALLAAPAAYATEGPSENPAPTQSEGETTEPEPEDSTPSLEPEPETSAPTTEPEPTASTPTTEPEPTASTPEETPSPSPSESTPEEDEEEEEPFPTCDADFKARLSGFPNKIVAGSGWKEFHLVLDNSEGEALETVIVGASVLYKKDAEGSFESDLTSKYAKFQYFDGEKWSSDLSDGGTIGGFLPVEAGEEISLKLRLNISASAPAGSAVAIAFGLYGDEENCSYDEKWYNFEILAAGKKPQGGVDDAKPEEGKSPVGVKPQGEVKEFKGQLAETGSSSALPMFALAGGAAVALGAGAVYLVRRRNGAGVDTSATA
ncbi:LAETG motif-containing sortase-dependent surface protein [Streptomyces megasporus]|uniref:LAETG motif-containing sortase-dependent surface protein n=1 Tax=Streptomyces megasporus TaxID=44060 RepID=UPI0004E0DF0B|nr:LAETG motif-containing sortase-dependent surface protein [Streptomyces megasporus]